MSKKNSAVVPAQSAISSSPHDDSSARSLPRCRTTLSPLAALWASSIQYENPADQPSGSILSYNTQFALTIGWMFPRRGSVFSLTTQLALNGGSILLCFGLAVISCENPALTNFCLPLPLPSTGYLTLMTLCSFVIALFANTVLQRWWAIRGHLGAMMNAASDVFLLLSTHLVCERRAIRMNDTALANDWRVRREKALRRVRGYLVLTLRLVFNAARKTEDFEDLRQRGLLTDVEYRHFVQTQATPLYVLSCLAALLEDTLREIHADPTSAAAATDRQLLLAPLLTIKSNIAACLAHVDVQLPYPLVQIVAAVVYAFLLQLTLVCASFLASGLYEPGQAADILTALLTISLYSFVLCGLLRLFEVLSNPLGKDAADFPGDTYLRNLENSLEKFLQDALALAEEKELFRFST